MPRSNRPSKIVLTRGLYEAVTSRRAAQRAAQALPPEDPKDLPWLCEDEIEAAESQRTGPQEIAPPLRARLTRAAKAKIAERSAADPAFERHSRKCALCRHPALDEIERAYLRWHSAYDICRFFQIDDPDTLYRHARAAALDVARRQIVRTVVENFIEQSRKVKITSSTVLHSIRALSCLDDNGRWTDPPRTHILVRGPDIRPAADLPETGQVSPQATEQTGDSPTSDIRAVGGVPSFEQREPYHGRDSGLLKNGDTEEDAGAPPSTEQREPHDENSPADSSFTGH
ncbi:MAG: hypothetical protein WBG29_13225 [Candidatus Acidiferrales bacterium]